MENKKYKLVAKDGEIICHQMLVENNLFGRMKGLMFSSELPDCDGFLINPCNSIHTFFMRYALDVIFLDRNFKIIKIIYNLNPWKMTGIYFKSHQVLEMKAGTLKKQLSPGEKLEAICIS